MAEGVLKVLPMSPNTWARNLMGFCDGIFAMAFHLRPSPVSRLASHFWNCPKVTHRVKYFDEMCSYPILRCHRRCFATLIVEGYMAWWQSVLLASYSLVFALLLLVSLHRHLMVHLYYKHRRVRPVPRGAFGEWPVVTVQLPVFNERYVVERLIRTVAKMDYPRDRLEIQVLDDSTDETTAIAAQCVDELRHSGLDIALIHRNARTGYKAGALAEGVRVARGEFIAIFDADFLPPPDFLTRTIPHFADSKVGMVQTRWGHLNRDYSLLTRVQAIYLDGHFVMEHGARSRSGLFFNFNGTAGVWRRTCIDDAGGWQHDTLTEDTGFELSRTVGRGGGLCIWPMR